MEAALEAARAKDTKERLAGVERLHEALDAAARRGLTAAEVTELVDTCVDLTRDANFRIAQGGLQALSAAAVIAGEHFKIHLNGLVPAAVERLGDGKQPVREAARQLLITLMEVSPHCFSLALILSEGNVCGFGNWMELRILVYSFNTSRIEF
jgi:CLIP-associating protein 1/2